MFVIYQPIWIAPGVCSLPDVLLDEEGYYEGVFGAPPVEEQARLAARSSENALSGTGSSEQPACVRVLAWIPLLYPTLRVVSERQCRLVMTLSCGIRVLPALTGRQTTPEGHQDHDRTPYGHPAVQLSHQHQDPHRSEDHRARCRR